MHRRTFIQAVAGTVAAMGLRSGSLQAKEITKRPPNVLFIMPDEWRGQALGCMGHPDVHTPHIDQLASEGMLFRQTFANTPVCCPARATILAGTYTSRNGMLANDLRLKESVTTLADLYGRAGYRTGFISKWHLDGGPLSRGLYLPAPSVTAFSIGPPMNVTTTISITGIFAMKTCRSSAKSMNRNSGPTWQSSFCRRRTTNRSS
jgi:Sulfatase